jgi:hypothetical protein
MPPRDADCHGEITGCHSRPPMTKPRPLENQMSTSALDPYLEAVRNHDQGKLSASLADDIVMHGPLVIEPITGRDQVLPVLGLAFGAVEDFRFGAILSAPGQYAVAFTGTIGGQDIEGIELLHLDGHSKIDSFTAFVRPLAAVVALQNQVAPALGIPAMSLTPTA